MTSYRAIFLGLVTALLVIASGGAADACFVAQPGAGLDRDELIDSAQSIYLVRVKAIVVDYVGDSVLVIEHKRGKIYDENFHKGMWETSEFFDKKYEFEIVEILKGDRQTLPAFDSGSTAHFSKDFANHTDDIFWNSDVGRSDWYGGACTPNHTFEFGEIYLLFPGQLAARKSAELIRSPKDQWLRYVRDRIAGSAE